MIPAMAFIPRTAIVAADRPSRISRGRGIIERNDAETRSPGGPSLGRGRNAGPPEHGGERYPVRHPRGVRQAVAHRCWTRGVPRLRLSLAVRPHGWARPGTGERGRSVPLAGLGAGGRRADAVVLGLLPRVRLPEVVLMLALGMALGPYGLDLATATTGPVRLRPRSRDAVPARRHGGRPARVADPRRRPRADGVAGLARSALAWMFLPSTRWFDVSAWGAVAIAMTSTALGPCSRCSATPACSSS